MAKITLEIDDKNLSTVLTILNNLKPGLVSIVESTQSQKTKKPVSSSINGSAQKAPKPVSSSIGGSGQKKYMSKSQYKEKHQQPVLEDEFLSKKTSTGKYLNPADYKNRLKNKEK